MQQIISGIISSNLSLSAGLPTFMGHKLLRKNANARIAYAFQASICDFAGRRNCLGESLARVTMFLFFVRLMQRYSVSLPAGCTADPTQTTTDMLRAPKPYPIIFSLRRAPDSL